MQAKHFNQSLSAETKVVTESLQAKLKQSQSKLEVIGEGDPIKLSELESKHLAACKEYAAYIFELELKLEKSLETSKLLADLQKRLEIVGAQNAELKRQVDSVKDKKSLSGGKRSLKDIRRIHDLELTVADLSAKITNPAMLSDIMHETRPDIPSSDQLAYLKAQIVEIEKAAEKRIQTEQANFLRELESVF